jgi:hypothetical protein
MQNNKLPPYFEKYFEQKFGEVNQNIAEIQKAITTCEVRVSTLESWKAELMGKLAVVSLFVIIAVNFFVDWVKTKLNLK